MKTVFHPGADMVVARSEKDLGLVLEPAKRRRVDDGGGIAVERPSNILTLWYSALNKLCLGDLVL
jgi:hypothetical protein